MAWLHCKTGSPGYLPVSDHVPRKSLGQHWLNDPISLQAMCRVGRVGAGDAVLEIGSGLGSLTAELVELADKVIAVELDSYLAAGLKAKISAKNLEVVQSDILHFDLTSLPRDYKVIANIPYYLTSKLLRVLCETSNPPETIVLLVQKEVAERIAAEPGGMSLLSISAQVYYEPTLDMVVPARLFTPPPKVDSQIIGLRRRAKPLIGTDQSREFFRLVRAGFSARRKTLHNSLSAGLQLSKTDTLALLQSADINPRTRPQELSLEQWQLLFEKSRV